MSAPEIIHQLVSRFEENRESYRSGKYNEAQLRHEFLDPFFAALGWDIYNGLGYSPEYRDVVVEDSLEIEGASKAPDYAFKIGKERKFFVEAKKPAVNIQFDIHPAYQLRRYAWNAHLAISILTDFEEFAVYNCKDKPNPTDSAATGRDKFYKYTEYIEKWDEIASIFSKDAVWKGSIDRYATSSKGKKGTTEVDDAFLKDIEEWRTLLARNIALRNPLIADERQLNYAVQMTIDRIIFLRICEDRGIEPDEQLKGLAKSADVYPQLVELFRKADTKYNSGLFHFSVEKGESTAADTFTPGLKIDDKTLKEIILSIYYPCPYIFKEIPVEILGQVYEQFLGKVIRLTAGHQAKIEEKPEVRKAGGVYYTPKYIVDYIVQNTVGKLLEGKDPVKAAELKVVDPACGSGSFLLGAYQHLLDWHIQWYTHNEPEKFAKGKNPAVMQASGGGWKLTTQKKKEILVNNIYGVDIDAQAVEVTKLSLLLKVLEEEHGQLSLGFERVLPDLGRNIQCGNSLIGEDYFECQLVVDEEERRRVNPFDWQRAFPQVFAQGGFDAVIGNPPYIRIQAMNEISPNEVEFYKKSYISASKGNYDIYVVFVEKGIALLNHFGKLGFILPHKFINANYGEPLRRIISTKKYLNKFVHFGDQQVFLGATTYTCLLFLSKLGSLEIEFTKIPDISNWISDKKEEIQLVQAESITSNNWMFSSTALNGKNLIPLSAYCEKIFQGLATSADSIFVLEVINEGSDVNRLLSKSLENSEICIESNLLHPLLKGSEISRYRELPYKYKILFPYKLVDGKAIPIKEKELITNYPLAYEYLKRNKAKLLARSKTDNTNWWLYPYPKNLALYVCPKILSQVLSDRGNFTIDWKGVYYFLGGGTAGGNAILMKNGNFSKAKYLLGLLNSKYTTSYIKKVGSSFRGGYFAFGKSSLSDLLIPNLNLNDPIEVKHHDRMVILVEHMLDLHKRTPVTPQEKESVQRQIEATDRQIDQLVYELYGLTEEEIKIVEGE
jgi:hypothetical protein